jgi:hypothetical protein
MDATGRHFSDIGVERANVDMNLEKGEVSNTDRLMT